MLMDLGLGPGWDSIAIGFFFGMVKVHSGYPLALSADFTKSISVSLSLELDTIVLALWIRVRTTDLLWSR